jgi:hypothetical protein
MKKNILLVHSLLTLPLMTSSIIVCMDTPSTDKPKLNRSELGKLRAQARTRALGIAEITTELIQQEKSEAAEDLAAAKNRPLNIAKEAKIDLTKLAQMLEAIPGGMALYRHLETVETSVMDFVRKDGMTTHFEARTKALNVPTITKEILEQEKKDAQEDLKVAKNLPWNISGLTELFDEMQSVPQAPYHVYGSEAAAIAQIADIKTTKEIPAPKDAKVEVPAPKVVKMELTEDLEKSIMAIAESEGFGFATSILNAFKSYRQIAINLLETDAFDPMNGTHKENFNKALEECAYYNDSLSLEKIINACQSKEKYQGLQSAANHVAPAFNFVAGQYQAQIADSNKSLALYNQELAQEMDQASIALKAELTKILTQHKEKVTALANAFDSKTKIEQDKEENLRKLLAGTAALNAKVKPYQDELFAIHQLTVPANSVRKIENDTHFTARSLMTHSNMPRASFLQIDNK